MENPATKADLQQAVTDVGRQFSEVLRRHAKDMNDRFERIGTSKRILLHLA